MPFSFVYFLFCKQTFCSAQPPVQSQRFFYLFKSMETEARVPRPVQGGFVLTSEARSGDPILTAGAMAC